MHALQLKLYHGVEASFPFDAAAKTMAVVFLVWRVGAIIVHARS
ncbi:hypothetical protein [Roseospira marina]|nr:hypothetical protein [Roseospira marina]MBB4312555.1 hypothetical protein [Roseospira marina]MBB5085429.1 hypothetical protein [Roseospira marina]